MLLRAGDDSSKPNAVERETAENECEEDEDEERRRGYQLVVMLY